MRNCTNFRIDMSEGQKVYQEYLESDHWQRLRKKAIDRDKGCLRCRSNRRLQVHHKMYRGSWFDTLLSDLETLCRSCHKNEHGINPWEWDGPSIDDEDIPEHAFVNPVEHPPITEFRTFSELEVARAKLQITRSEYVKLKKVFREQGLMILPRKIRQRMNRTKCKPLMKPNWSTTSGSTSRWQNRGRSSN